MAFSPRAPRTLVVVAHPDDEVLALGGRLSRHADSFFVHVTDGAPLDGLDAARHGFASLKLYREARSRELKSAFRLAGIGEASCVHIGIPDQRASFDLVSLTESLRALVLDVAPQAILTHPYEGGHPDHDACAFAVHTAVTMLDRESCPVILEAGFYHAGPQGIETNCFLPSGLSTTQVTRHLSPEEKMAKQALLDCFVTQRDVLSYFDPGVQIYRIAPTYDFTQGPHSGQLFYEQFPWGMTGERFRHLAGEALAAMGCACP